MKGQKKSTLTILKVVTTFVVIGSMVIAYGCGGGGGGGGTSSGINYAGVTFQAIIDENNAIDISTGSLFGEEMGSNLNVLGAVSENTNPGKSPLVFDIASYFQKVIHKIENSTKQNAAYVGAIVSESETIAGSCGGSFFINVTADDQTGNTNGSLTFNNFCEPEFKANGSMNLSGNINVNTEEINYFEMTFNSINLISGQESIDMKGSIDFNLQSSPMRMTMSFVLKDNNLNKTYKYENFVYEYTQGFGFIDMTLTGRYYDHDSGYVIIATESPLRIYEYDLWPSSGTITAAGDLSTKARLIVIDSSSFFVEADTDGDGLYDDYSSGALLWSSVL